MSIPSSEDRLELAGTERRALAAGCIALGLCLVGALFNPEEFFRAYLAAYLFFLGLGLGSMVILMVYHLTGGAWGFVVRRVLEAQMKTIPLLAVFFAPIAWGIGYLYLWAQPDVVRTDEHLQYQQFYMNAPFFWLRAVIYFLLWMGSAWLLASWSRKEDRTGHPRYPWRSEQLSGPGLVAYGVAIHFASIDWVLSLQPVFISTIIGPLTAAGQVLAAYAFALVCLAWLVDRAPLSRAISLQVLNDLGNLLLTFLVVWSYMVWFQFMLIWIANLPEEVVWFAPVAHGGWMWLGIAFLVFAFTIPFLALLVRAVKQRPRLLAGVAALILFTQLAFSYFQVLPHFHAYGASQHWMDFLMPVGIGGIWLAYFFYQWERQPVLPLHDANAKTAEYLRWLDAEEAILEEVPTHE